MIEEYMEGTELILSIAQKDLGHPIIITIDINENIHNKVWFGYKWIKL